VRASPQPERIGLLGGTFDPPHAGHVAAALHCREALHLDRLLLVVANHPWQKAPLRAITPAEDRFAMVEAAVAGLDGVEASRIEIDRGGPSYTIETVEAFRSAAVRAGRPMPEIFVVIGADLVATLPSWERVDELRLLVTLAIVSRPRSRPTPAPDGWRVAWVEGGGVDVSSSQVRALLSEGHPAEDMVPGLVPEAVMGCIRRRDLYAVGR